MRDAHAAKGEAHLGIEQPREMGSVPRATGSSPLPGARPGTVLDWDGGASEVGARVGVGHRRGWCKPWSERRSTAACQGSNRTTSPRGGTRHPPPRDSRDPATLASEGTRGCQSWKLVTAVTPATANCWAVASQLSTTMTPAVPRTSLCGSASPPTGVLRRRAWRPSMAEQGRARARHADAHGGHAYTSDLVRHPLLRSYVYMMRTRLSASSCSVDCAKDG